MIRHTVRELDIEKNSCLMRPASRDIPHSVTSATEDQEWKIETLHVLHTATMASDGEIETSQSIPGERIRTTLQDDRTRTIDLHHAFDHTLEDVHEGIIVHPVMEWEVQGIVFTLLRTDIVHSTCPGEVFSELVEGHRHHCVCVCVGRVGFERRKKKDEKIIRKQRCNTS